MKSSFTVRLVSALCLFQNCVTAESSLDAFRTELGRNMNLYHKVYLQRNMIRYKAIGATLDAQKLFVSDSDTSPSVDTKHKRDGVVNDEQNEVSDAKPVFQDEDIIRQTAGGIPVLAENRQTDTNNADDMGEYFPVIKIVISDEDEPLLTDALQPKPERHVTKNTENQPSADLINAADVEDDSDISDIKVIVPDEKIIKETDTPVFHPKRQTETEDTAGVSDASDSVIKIVISDKDVQQLPIDALQPVQDKLLDPIVGRQLSRDAEDDSDISDIKVVIQDAKIIKETDTPVFNPKRQTETEDTAGLSDASDSVIKTVISDKDVQQLPTDVLQPVQDKLLDPIVGRQLSRDTEDDSDISGIKVFIPDEKIIKESDTPVFHPKRQTETADTAAESDASDSVIKIVISDKDVQQLPTDVLQPVQDKLLDPIVGRQLSHDAEDDNDISDVKVFVPDEKMIKESDTPVFHPKRQTETEDTAGVSDASDSVIKIVISDKDVQQLPTDALQPVQDKLLDPIVGRQLSRDAEDDSDISDIKVFIQDAKIIKESDTPVFNPKRQTETEDTTAEHDASDSVIKIVISDKDVQQLPTDVLQPVQDKLLDPIVGRQLSRDAEDDSDISDIKVFVPDEKIIKESDTPVFHPKRQTETEDTAGVSDASDSVIKIVISDKDVQQLLTDVLQPVQDKLLDPIVGRQLSRDAEDDSDISDIKVVIQDAKIIKETDTPVFNPKRQTETEDTAGLSDASDSVIKIVISDKDVQQLPTDAFQPVQDKLLDPIEGRQIISDSYKREIDDKNNDNDDGFDSFLKVFISDESDINQQIRPDPHNIHSVDKMLDGRLVKTYQYETYSDDQERDITSVKVFVSDDTLASDNKATDSSPFKGYSDHHDKRSDINFDVSADRSVQENRLRSVGKKVRKEIEQSTKHSIINGKSKTCKNYDWFNFIESLPKITGEDIVAYYRNWHEVPSLLSNESREEFTRVCPNLPLKTAIHEIGGSDTFINTFWPFRYDIVKKNLLIALYGVKGRLNYTDHVKTNFYKSVYETYSIPVPVEEKKIILSYDDHNVVKFLNMSNLFLGSSEYIVNRKYRYNTEERNIIENKITSALRLIYKTSPELYKSITELITCISVYRSEESQRIGGSSSAVPGVIYLNANPLEKDWPVTYYAEQIVHEFIHNMLYLEEFIIGMYQNYKLLSKVKVVSSIRGVPRNFDLSLHAAYVSTGLVTFSSRIGYYERAEDLAAPLKTSVEALMEANSEHHIMSVAGEAILQHMADMITLMRL